MSTNLETYRPRRMNHKRSFPKWIIASITIVALLCGAGVYAFNDIWNRVDTQSTEQFLSDVDRPEKVQVHYETPVDGFNGPLNILVMGSDSRGEKGIAHEEGMRADTSILLHISQDRQRVDMISIPRDSLMEVPSCTLPDGSQTAPTVDKFNSAYALGGQTGDIGAAASCTIKMFEDATNLYIDGFVVVDFNGFKDMVDALGGIEFTVQEDVIDPDFENLVIKAGKQTFDGTTALQYARVRKAVGQDGSDISRIDRQQELFSAIISKAKNKISDLPAMYNFVGSVANMITTSDDFGDTRKLSGLVWALKDTPKENINFHTVPVVEAGDGANLYWDQSAWTLWANLKEDYPLAPVETTEPTESTTEETIPSEINAS